MTLRNEKHFIAHQANDLRESAAPISVFDMLQGSLSAYRGMQGRKTSIKKKQTVKSDEEYSS